VLFYVYRGGGSRRSLMFGLETLFSKGKRLVGLDIGSTGVKLLVGELKGAKFFVDQLIVEPFPASNVEVYVTPENQVLIQALSKCFDQVALRKFKIGVGIKGAGILTKKITLPKIPKGEIPEQVRWEAEQVFPQDVATTLVDHIVLGEAEQIPNAPKGTRGWEILLVGVHRDEVAGWRDTVTIATGVVGRIDLDACSTGDLIDTAFALSKKRTIALVDVGASGTRVNVRIRGSTVFIREFPIGGNTFTDVIGQNLGLSFADAEALKIQSSEGKVPAEAKEALEAVFFQWKSELQQCEDIFVSQELNSVIDEWHFYGGGMLCPGLMDALKDDRFKGKCYEIESEKFFKIRGKGIEKDALKQWSNRLLTAAGLADKSE
jgi:type IV pilus assembly protein PilM